MSPGADTRADAVHPVGMFIFEGGDAPASEHYIVSFAGVLSRPLENCWPNIRWSTGKLTCAGSDHHAAPYLTKAMDDENFIFSPVL